MFESVSRSLVLLALAAAPAAAQVVAEAQPVLPPCVQGDDNFGLGCCTEPAPSYPNFPAVESKGKYACLFGCSLESESEVTVKLGQPVFTLCDTATIPVTISSAAPGGPNASGRMTAKYSRTWELRGNGIKQVWRFLLNGDLTFTSVVSQGSECPVPPKGSTDGHHFVGHVDYVCDPAQAHVQLLLDSLSLSHLPGCISHAPGGARPETGTAAHYDRSYHLVAPNNFTFAAGSGGNFPGGPVFGEAVRPSAVGQCFPSSYSCLGEAEVLGGEYFSANCDVCLCSSYPCDGPWRHYGMSVPVECGKDVTVLQGARGVYPVAPEGIVGQHLGAWSGSPLKPLASTDLYVKFGAVNLAVPCTGEKEDDHTVFGVATFAVPGSEPTLYGNGNVVSTFIDLQASLIAQPSITPVDPLCLELRDQFGAPAFADFVINLNN